ncbi:hypothetical protein [Paenibacillus xylanilyticus]|uniref:hypothetical protein n=1 Tax=Paenibacillus xylanilyticus TaxID=248903 RepID=UPI003AAF251B
MSVIEVTWNYFDVDSSVAAMSINADAPVFYVKTDTNAVDSIELSVDQAEDIIIKLRGMLDELDAKRKQEPRQLAEVLPFVPRLTPEQEAQMELVSLLERYAELARAGEVTGVIIAAKTKGDVLTGEIMAEYMNVNTRERTLLIEEMREVSYYDYDI